MNKNLKHVVIIPARKNSKGLKNKNRKLFENTAKFLKKISFLEMYFKTLPLVLVK